MPTNQKANKNIPFLALGGQFGSAHLKAKVLTGTTHATPGTAITVAHGLGYAPELRFIRKGNAYITAVDATNITVASAAASQTFEIFVIEQG